jgi:hypothetical protein
MRTLFSSGSILGGETAVLHSFPAAPHPQATARMRIFKETGEPKKYP